MNAVDQALQSPATESSEPPSSPTENHDKMSAECAALTATWAPDLAVQVLIRPSNRASSTPAEPCPDGVTDAVRSAGSRLGTGRKLIRHLRSDLSQRAAELLTLLPQAEPLWLADALGVTVPVGRLAELARRPDVRRIELQPIVQPARRSHETTGRTAATPELELELGPQDVGLLPRIALLDSATISPDFAAGDPALTVDPYDPVGNRWLATLQELIPEARLLPIRVFEPGPGPHPQGTFAHVVLGLQRALEQEADLVLLDLGEQALSPVWHLPLLNCTLHGTSVAVAGFAAGLEGEPSLPIHLPLAGCYAGGPLRTDLQVSGAALGRHGLAGSLAAACRAAAAITLIQRVAPKLRHRPDLVAGLLFGGSGRARRPGGNIPLDAGSALRAALSAA